MGHIWVRSHRNGSVSAGLGCHERASFFSSFWTYMPSLCLACFLHTMLKWSQVGPSPGCQHWGFTCGSVFMCTVCVPGTLWGHPGGGCPAGAPKPWAISSLISLISLKAPRYFWVAPQSELEQCSIFLSGQVCMSYLPCSGFLSVCLFVFLSLYFCI